MSLLTLSGRPAASPLGYNSWAVFEWARNPYVILVTIYIFAPYFSTTVVGDPVKGQSLLGFTNALSGAMIALMAPLLGAIADKSGRRKPWIFVFVLVMVPAIFALWFAEKDGGGIGIYPTLALIVLIAVMFEFSAVFHNAMLPSVAPASRVGSISGLALAMGNIGGLLLMVFVLYAFALPGNADWAFLPDAPLFGLDQQSEQHNRIVGPLTAVWLLVFALPLFLFTPDDSDTSVPVAQAVRQGLKEVWVTIKAVSHYSNVALFLVARMIFNDGLVGILIFSGVYAAGTFGWDTISLLIFGILTSLSAAVGAVIGGIVDDRFGSRTAVLIAVGGTAILLVIGVSLQPTSILYLIDIEPGVAVWDSPYFQTLPELLYFLNTQLFGMFITVGFASARTMMARISPPDMITQFFGLYALSGTATAFLAPLLVGFFTAFYASQRAGFASLIILLVLGFLLMLFVKETPSTRVR